MIADDATIFYPRHYYFQSIAHFKNKEHALEQSRIEKQ